MENGVLSFTYSSKDPLKGRQVKYAREAESDVYNYKHHISDRDLDVLSANFVSIPDRKDYENKFGKHYLKQWGQDLKKAIAQLMLDGDFVLERKLDNDKNVMVKYIWDGEIPKEFKV